MLRRLVLYFVARPRRMFLLDGLGAAASALLLLLIAAFFEPLIGLSRAFLLPMATVAVALAAYSLTCAAVLPARWPRLLLGLSAANSAYCAGSALVVLANRTRLTGPGIAYFAGEIVLVLGLATLEWLVAAERIRSPSTDLPS